MIIPNNIICFRKTVEGRSEYLAERRLPNGGRMFIGFVADDESELSYTKIYRAGNREYDEIIKLLNGNSS